MVRTIRLWSYHTSMVYKIVPYTYGTYHTRMVCTIRVWYVPHAYGIKYAYGTEQQHVISIITGSKYINFINVQLKNLWCVMHKLQESNIFINVQLKNLWYVCIKLMIHVYNSWLSKMVVVKQCNVSLAIGSGYR